MAKINRYTGDLQAFGSNAAGTERTVFGAVLYVEFCNALE
jgi:hypothetical protein